MWYIQVLTIIIFYPWINSVSYHFSKGGSGWAGGIGNVYYDPCQDWLDLINMKLTSPNYPEPFDKLEDCTWYITGPSGHYVTLDFEMIDVIIKDMSFLI